MPRLYLLTDCAGSWPLVTDDELAESLADGAIAVQLVGVFEDDSEGWMRLGDEITRVVVAAHPERLLPTASSLATAWPRGIRPSARRPRS